jgi:hypothetical protein
MKEQFPGLTVEESGWIGDTASRLRLIHADVAASPPEQRRELVREEIDRRLSGIPPASRKRYLSALLERFPIAGAVVGSAPVPIQESPVPAPPETPQDTLARFLGILESLPEEKRAEFAKPVRDLFPAADTGQRVVLEVGEELQRALGLPPDRQPRLDRLAQLAVQLIEVCSLLDQTALKGLNQLSPRNALLKRNEDFRKAAARYLVGDADSVEASIRALTGIIGALLAAMLASGKDFGRQYLERFSPAAIEDVVGGEGGKLFGPNKKERCWDKYIDLARDFATPDLIDRKIKDCLVAVIDKAAARPAPPAGERR